MPDSSSFGEQRPPARADDVTAATADRDRCSKAALYASTDKLGKLDAKQEGVDAGTDLCVTSSREAPRPRRPRPVDVDGFCEL